MENRQTSGDRHTISQVTEVPHTLEDKLATEDRHTSSQSTEVRAIAEFIFSHTQFIAYIHY
jgi:hypothetical protein